MIETDLRILVSKLNHLGDAVTFAPTLAGLRRVLPSAEITVLCTPIAAEVFGASIDGVVLRVVPFDLTRGVRSVPRLLRSWVEDGWGELDWSLHSYDEPSFSYVLACLLGARRRIGYSSGVAMAQRLLTEKVPFDTRRNVIDINYDLVRQAIGDWKQEPVRAPLRPLPSDVAVVDGKLAELGVGADTPFAVIHPGAKLAYRRWDLSRYLSLARRLELELGMPTIIVDGPVAPRATWARLVTDLNIRQLAYLCRRASVFIGNNSGPMHVAIAMGTPTVAVQGPNAANWDRYWGDVLVRNVKRTDLPCLPCDRLGAVAGVCTNTASPHACMEGLSVSLILEHVREILGPREGTWSERSVPADATATSPETEVDSTA